MALEQITRKNWTSLLQSMDPSHHLLGRLMSVPFIEGRISDISQQVTDEQKNVSLLSALREVPEDIEESVMGDFISALRASGQDHVANIYRKENDKVIMSDKHRKLLETKRPMLGQYMNHKDGLIGSLISDEILSQTDEDKILSKACLNDKAEEMVNILMRKSDCAFEKFVSALHATNQSHVAYILTGEGKSQPLKEEYRKKLLSEGVFLVDQIDSKNTHLITALVSKGVFSIYDEQCVTSVQPDTNSDRNKMILNLIVRKSQSHFREFISALNETNQSHVVVQIIGADVIAKIRTEVYERIPAGHTPDLDEELLKYMTEIFIRGGEEAKRLTECLKHKGVSVSSVTKGCIEITFSCKNLKSLHYLEQIHDSGELHTMVNEAFCPRFVKKGLKSLQVEISKDQFEQRIPMTTEHRGALSSAEKKLVDKVAVSSNLLDKMSLCQRRREAIEGAATGEQQVKTLLDVVSRQPDSAFKQLLKALNDTHQAEAAGIISADINSETKHKDNELEKKLTTDAWNEADHKLELLLGAIRHAFCERVQTGGRKSHQLDEDIPSGGSTAGNVVYEHVRDLVTSVHNLRNRYGVPTSTSSIVRSLQQLMNSTQGRQSVIPRHQKGT